MQDSRRRFLAQTAKQAAVLATASVAGWRWSWASDKPIRILVGFPPGGGTDVIARLLQEPLSQRLGRTVIIENKPGAGGQIAAQQLKASIADGTTLFLTHDHTISILPQVVRHAGFDPAQDFEPVGGFASFVNTFAVSGMHPAKTFDEYLQWVRQASSSRSAVGIPAPASTPEFLVKQIAQRYQLDLIAAPYKGSAPMIGDMLGRQIEAGIGSVQDFVNYHKEGKLRVLAVLGGQRQPLLPDVPTFTELGLKGLEDMPYYGIYAPKGVPQAFVQQFSQALAQSVQEPHIREQLQALGLVVDAMTPAQLHQRETAYTGVWKRIIADSGFTPQ
ncbi:MAG: Bug family tripartite tricarboxylate transporter substrate binding protein [Comamonas sp.]